MIRGGTKFPDEDPMADTKFERRSSWPPEGCARGLRADAPSRTLEAMSVAD